jgi:transglutaminase-like putative cysteine protease
VTTADFRRERERLHETHYEFLTATARVPALAALEGLAPDTEAAPDATPLYDLVREATDRVNGRLAHDFHATRVDTPLETVLDLGRGASQDFSHLLIGTLRRMGIPARYVSGYGFKIHGTPEDEAPAPAVEGTAPAGGVARRRSSHSWVEAALPGVGWCGIDPTHARPVDNRYIKIAVGRDYDDIVPVKGVFRGSGTQALEVDVEIWAVSESDQVEGF